MKNVYIVTLKEKESRLVMHRYMTTSESVKNVLECATDVVSDAFGENFNNFDASVFKLDIDRMENNVEVFF